MNPGQGGNLTEDQKKSIWYLTANDKQNYMKIFKMFDSNGSGNLTDSEMQKVMQQTKLDRGICAKVWDLSNSHGAETFTKPMFFIAMHLMYKKRMNNDIELPTELPPELVASAQEDGSQPSNNEPTKPNQP